MKKYTQEEFDNFKVVNGYKICQSGDYSNIKILGENCSFGDCCSFGDWCSFGEYCIFGQNCSFENKGEAKKGYPFQSFIGCGSRFGSRTYIFNLQKGIFVRCGCYFGTLKDFKERVLTVNSDPDYIKIVDILANKLK